MVRNRFIRSYETTNNVTRHVYNVKRGTRYRTFVTLRKEMDLNFTSTSLTPLSIQTRRVTCFYTSLQIQYPNNGSNVTSLVRRLREPCYGRSIVHELFIIRGRRDPVVINSLHPQNRKTYL